MRIFMMLHAPEAQPAITNRFAAKRMKRKELVSSNREPQQHPYSWRETLLRTDYKDTGAGRAVSNDRWAS